MTFSGKTCLIDNIKSHKKVGFLSLCLSLSFSLSVSLYLFLSLSLSVSLSLSLSLSLSKTNFWKNHMEEGGVVQKLTPTKPSFFFWKRQPLEKNFIVEEKLDCIDGDDIGNLEDLIQSLTNAIEESISSISIWNILNHLGKYDFSCGWVVNNLKESQIFSDLMNRNRFDSILARRYWSCSAIENLRWLNSAVNKII